MAWPTTSRHQRGYGTAHDKMRAHLIATVILCEECTRQGRSTPGTIADHIKPLANGGTGTRSNYQLLCRPCSDAKTLTDKGQSARPKGGVDRAGRPTTADHPWNRPKRT
jgi:5-methylcytosine-specific restriction protein A